MEKGEVKYYYSGGLNIISNISIPEAYEIEEVTEVDVEICVREESEYKKLGKKDKIEVQREYKKCIYAIPNVAYIKVEDGKSIEVYPKENTERRVMRLFILGIAYGELLRQRGNLVFHSSAVSSREEAHLFMGKKGAGKSTLASLFLRNGYSLLSDDLVPVGNEKCPTVKTMTKHLKLWKESNDGVGDISAESYKSHPNVEKFTNIFECNNKEKNYKVKKFFVIKKGKSIGIKKLSPSESLGEIIKNSYISPKVIPSEKEKKRYFERSARLVESVDVYKLFRTNDFSKSAELFSLIEDVIKDKKHSL